MSFSALATVSTAALSHLRPLVTNVVDQNVQEIRRSSAYIDSPEEQKHLNYIADTMQASMETASRSLDCCDIVHSMKMKAGHQPNLSLGAQLDDLLKKQSEILTISANSLMRAKQHYSHSFMPGGLSDTPMLNAKCIAFTVEDSPSPQPLMQTQTQCKDVAANDDDDDAPSAETEHVDNLQQMLSKIQVCVQAKHGDNNMPKLRVVGKHNEAKDNDEGKHEASAADMRKYFVKGMMLATHFATAVFLALKHEINSNNENTNGNDTLNAMDTSTTSQTAMNIFMNNNMETPK